MTCTLACGDESRSGMDAGVMPSLTASIPSTTDTATGDATSSAAPTTPVTPTVTAPTGTAPSGAGGVGAVGGMGGMGGAGGSGATCEVASLTPFARSDTADSWDDNDFSDVVTEPGCPLRVNVTWPHEAYWENADPAESNHEQTHFTLDAYYSTDLTGKQLNATVELTAQELGPTATAAGYIVSIVSVSSFDRIVVLDDGQPDAGALDAGWNAGLVSDGGALDAGAPDAALADAISDAGEDGPLTTTETGYAETELALEDRAILRHVGDRATVTFRLPDPPAEVGSYDPSKVIKINVRIYSMWTGAETTSALLGEASVDAGVLDAGVALDGGITVVDAGAGGQGAGGQGAGGQGAGGQGAGGQGAGGMPPSSNGRVYDYLTSQFAITNFTVSDVGLP